MSSPVITFLSDYGTGDGFVGVCHGVIVRICPEARIVDITHGVPRHNVLAGALALAAALPYMPAGVHLAVVDPGVGASRRAVAVACADGRVAVGPDNGLLMLAAEASGGVVQAADIGRSPVRLEPVSATFHGRDIFAPVSAHLAAGTALRDLGELCDPDGLARLDPPRAHVEASGRIRAHVIYVDGFGNAQLDVRPGTLEPGRSAVLSVGTARGGRVPVVRTFADAAPGELLIYEDADQRVAVAVNQGSAAERLGLRSGDEVAIEPA